MVQPQFLFPDDTTDIPRASSVEEVLMRDDLDGALRFFAAVGAEEDEQRAGPGGAFTTPSAGAAPLDFSRYRARRIRERLLILLDALVVAIERRDLQAVWDVLDEGDACRCFPPAVREEALVIAGLPRTARRPPVRLYRYYHVLRQLDDAPTPSTGDENQLTLDLPRVSGESPAEQPRGRSRVGTNRRRGGHR